MPSRQKNSIKKLRNVNVAKPTQSKQGTLFLQIETGGEGIPLVECEGVSVTLTLPSGRARILRLGIEFWLKKSGIEVLWGLSAGERFDRSFSCCDITLGFWYQSCYWVVLPHRIIHRGSLGGKRSFCAHRVEAISFHSTDEEEDYSETGGEEEEDPISSFFDASSSLLFNPPFSFSSFLSQSYNDIDDGSHGCVNMSDAGSWDYMTDAEMYLPGETMTD